MRKLLFTLAFIATLTTSVPTMAQKHRHTPRTQELVDTTSSAATAIEAYSDTTATATDTITSYNNNSSNAPFASFDYDGGDEGFGAKFIITVCFILFVLAPISIIGLIFYFIRQSRKDKIRLAELAAQTDNPFPPTCCVLPKTAMPTMLPVYANAVWASDWPYSSASSWTN